MAGADDDDAGAVARFGIGGIDGPLGGGLRRGLVVDVYGPPASGKTQLACRACASAAAAGRRVLFVDARGEFRPERVLAMAGGPAAGDPAELLDRITVSRAASSAEQAALVGPMSGFDLAVVEGLTDLFTFEFDLRERNRRPSGRRAAARHLEFAGYARALSAAASEGGTAVLATNSVRSAGDGSGRTVESLGAAVSMFAHARIKLELGAGPGRAWTSGTLATLGTRSRFAFEITDAGLKERDAPPPDAGEQAGGASADRAP